MAVIMIKDAFLVGQSADDTAAFDVQSLLTGYGNTLKEQYAHTVMLEVFL